MDSWVRAWSARDFDTYVAAYSPDFKGSSASREAWLDRRAARVAGHREINITLTDVEIALLDDMRRAQVRFEQDYRRGAFRSVERREVAMSRTGDRWLIDAESGR